MKYRYLFGDQCLFIIIIIIIIITLSNTTFSFLFYALFDAQRCPDENQTVQVLPTGSQSARAPGKPSSKEWGV